MIQIKQGLNLSLSGEPEQKIYESPRIESVALLAADELHVAPDFLVSVGEHVKCGQALWADQNNPGVLYTAPAGGIVSSILFDIERNFQALIIKFKASRDELFESFSAHSFDQLAHISPLEIRRQLILSGMWVAFRTRPFSKVPPVDATPCAIFVNAAHTYPHAPDVSLVVAGYLSALMAGLRVIRRLVEDIPVFVVTHPHVEIPVIDQVQVVWIDGPHPSGCVGTHIHALYPVNEKTVVWSIDYQEVIAIGFLFLQGKLYMNRVIALSGDAIKYPRLLLSRVGALATDLLAQQLQSEEYEVWSGSVWAGRAIDEESLAFLGRFHHQFLVRQKNQATLGWQAYLDVWFQPWMQAKKKLAHYLSFFPLFSFSASNHPPPFFPIESYQAVVPFNLEIIALLRALVMGDVSEAKRLGCLQLAEEDLALCTYICPSHFDFGALLRQCLNAIEQDHDVIQ